MGLVADGLVVFKNALLDDGKLGGFHAIVVEARGGQAALGGAVAPYVHQVAAHAQRAHLVRGQEAGPGEVGLVAQGAIQLRGMPDALVNGEPEMARHQHQVLLAGCDRRRVKMFDHLRADALRVFDQVHQRHIFVSGGDLLGLIAARLRKPALEIRRRGVHSAVSLQIELLDGRSHRRSEVLVFGPERQVAIGREDPLLFLYLGGGRADQLQLLFERHRERVAFMRRLPALAIDGDRGQFNRLGSDGHVGARHRHRLADHARDFLLGDQRRGGKAPCAVHDHAHPEAERTAIGHYRHFQRLARAALGVQPHGEELLAVSNNTDTAYEALSFLASRKAAAPRFSSSGLGLVEPSGAANRRVASAAAVPDSMNARLVSMLSPLEILSIHMARGRAGLLHEKTGVESIYDAAHRDAGRHANTGCSGLWAETARLLLCPLYRTRASSPRRNCRLQRRRQAGHHIFWRRRLFLHRLYIPAPVVVGQWRWHVPAGSAAAHPIRRILRRRRRSERGRQAGPGSLPLTERLCAAKPTADPNQSRRRDLPPGAVALRLPRSAYNCRLQWRWQARHLRWRREPLAGQWRRDLYRAQRLQSASAISTYNRGLQRRRPARPGCHSFT